MVSTFGGHFDPAKQQFDGTSSEPLPGLTRSPTRVWRSISAALWPCAGGCVDAPPSRMMVSPQGCGRSGRTGHRFPRDAGGVGMEPAGDRKGLGKVSEGCRPCWTAWDGRGWAGSGTSRCTSVTRPPPHPRPRRATGPCRRPSSPSRRSVPPARCTASSCCAVDPRAGAAPPAAG